MGLPRHQTETSDGGVAEEASPRITHAMEDYLKAVYRLKSDGGAVTTQRLADELGISGPSVTNMVKRLDELKMVRHARYQGVELTDAGERVALEVLRHHRLLEVYLAESLGFPWDEVHAEAERLEHLVSDELERRIDRALGHPTFDPHGAPIPSSDGVMPTHSDRRLVDLDPGDVAVVEQVSDRDPEQLRYLATLGLRPGQRVELMERLPFEGPIRLRVGDDEHLIGAPLARIVFVVNEPDGSEGSTP
ncbi:MAG TPA: metal-dependent transcriptional regulator [Thermomicrobiales bacterium]|nr:metal-dependent transcriptional regulator [Thermomicrobiales bacterium]